MNRNHRNTSARLELEETTPREIFDDFSKMLKKKTTEEKVLRSEGVEKTGVVSEASRHRGATSNETAQERVEAFSRHQPRRCLTTRRRHGNPRVSLRVAQWRLSN